MPDDFMDLPDAETVDFEKTNWSGTVNVRGMDVDVGAAVGQYDDADGISRLLIAICEVNRIDIRYFNPLFIMDIKEAVEKALKNA